MEVGTVETEPLLALVSGLGSSVGLWRLLPTMQHLPTQHPATATPLLQPHPPLGTGVIPTSNITHMCPIAQLHGGRYSSKVQTPTESGAAQCQCARGADCPNGVNGLDRIRCWRGEDSNPLSSGPG
jgi:hypothetical protein